MFTPTPQKIELCFSIKCSSFILKLYSENPYPLPMMCYFAFAGRCYSLLPIMLKIFDVICQLADDFYEKCIFFLVGFYPYKSVRDFALSLLTICKRLFSVNGQIFFNRTDKSSVLCLTFFGHAL